MLIVNNLSVFYKSDKIKKYLLNNVCFSLNDGDSLGIIGKSGEGKSTLAKALVGIYDKNIFKDEGEIIFDNNRFNNSFRGKKIALLFQNPNSYLNPLMKVGKQIDKMAIYHLHMKKKLAKEMALSLMKEVGIANAKEIYHYYPFELSGGLQQRICLCIALICNPKILVLDECTSYLDNESKQEILNLIKRLQNKYHFSLIMISHDFKEIYSMCDNIAIMNKGEIIEIDTKDEVILNPKNSYCKELLYDYWHYNSENCSLNSSSELDYEKIKESIYENLRN